MFENAAKYLALFGCALACEPSASDLFETPGGGAQPSTGGGAGTSSMAPAAGAASGGAPMQMGGASGAASNAGASMGGALAMGGVSEMGGSDTAGSAGSAGSAGNMAGSGAGGEPGDPVPAVCGNGTLELGEECDDGGLEDQDGCSADCKVVCSDFDRDSVESADHHCFAGFDAFDYADSVSDCETRGAHLATITDATENELVRHLVHDSKWIGARDDVDSAVKGDGTYTWLDGAALSYTNWAKQEPNQQQYWCGYDKPCFEHCVALLGDGTWADRPCSAVDGYICEWDPAGMP